MGFIFQLLIMSLLKSISQKVKIKNTYKTSQNLKRFIPKFSKKCINSRFLKPLSEYSKVSHIFGLSKDYKK